MMAESNLLCLVYSLPIKGKTLDELFWLGFIKDYRPQSSGSGRVGSGLDSDGSDWISLIKKIWVMGRVRVDPVRVGSSFGLNTIGFFRSGVISGRILGSY
jgi:hypothetical protein